MKGSREDVRKERKRERQREREMEKEERQSFTRHWSITMSSCSHLASAVLLSTHISSSVPILGPTGRSEICESDTGLNTAHFYLGVTRMEGLKER